MNIMNGDVTGLCLFALSVQSCLVIAQRAALAESDTKLDTLKLLRNDERKSRISMQKKNRIQKDAVITENGYNYRPIGFVESPFRERRGTPRQPMLVTAATGRIRMVKQLIQPEHFAEIKEFSHIWVVFVFHDNTNR